MRVWLLLLTIVWAVSARAQDPAPAAEAAPPEERAKALHAQADAMRKDAEASFEADNKSCWDKFLVTRCLDEAKRTKNDRLAASRRVEQEARALERAKRHREFDEREARRIEEEPRRAAEAAAQAEKNRRERAEAIGRVERKRQEADERENKSK